MLADTPTRVLVAMSGGVDSSVALALLAEAGHEVVGATMKLWGGESDTGCCSVSDVDDARRVADYLGVEHHVFNFGEEFDSKVVAPYVEAHRAGRTPNPCVECNRHIKFDRFLRRAQALGFDAVATGHHARVVRTKSGELRVARGVDAAKDQSYVLWMLKQAELEKLLLPIGGMTKQEVRQNAESLGIRTAQKPDSQDVCFITKAQGRRQFLEPHVAYTSGQVVDSLGEKLGGVDAVELVTIGQRKGLSLGGNSQPLYALDVDVESATVVAGSRQELLVAEQPVAPVEWTDGVTAQTAISDGPDDEVMLVQTRAHGAPAEGSVLKREIFGGPAVASGGPAVASGGPAVASGGPAEASGGPAQQWLIRWSQPQPRVAPGQSIVFYKDDMVVGGTVAEREVVAPALSQDSSLPPVAPQYFLRTFGCQMNEHDSERIAGLLEEDGLTRTDAPDTADVVVLNTCCIRENADNKLYGNLGQLKQLKDSRPGMQIAVAGCLAQKDRDLIRTKAPYVDVVFGTHNVHRAAELLRHARQHGPVVEILEEATLDDNETFPSALPARRESDLSAWVTIQIGCDNSCAFCIVPAVRGPEISRPFQDILDEVKQVAASGVCEVTLLGQNVNSYGRDLQLALRRQGEDVKVRPLFADLLKSVGEVEGIRRVRFTSPHPKDMRPETFEAMADTPSVCEHLHFPLQSGSDKILAAMHRGYTAEKYLAKLVTARSVIDDLAVSTDIIVGFPGETEADFERTLEVAAEAEFDSAFTFVFSPRPGTEAASMEEDFLDPDVVRERYERLRVVIQRSAIARHRQRVGRTEEVLVEGPSKRDPKMVTGRTRQNKLVHLPAGASEGASEDTSGALSAGSFASVRITDSTAHYLHGELLEVLSHPPVRKTSTSPAGNQISKRSLIPVVAG